MKTSWVISDTHFSHTNSWQKFKRDDGSPLRPFTSTEEMDETIVERWNAVVKPGDHVYHLGDVSISKKGLQFVNRLNGRKRLIRGNHDIYSDNLYREVGFEKIYGVRVFVDKFILSHIPLHPDCITNRFKVNVHGHTHANEVTREVRLSDIDEWFDPDKMTDRKIIQPDPRYLSVSVEHTNYMPLSFEEVDQRIAERWAEFGYKGPDNAWGNGSGPD